MALLTGCQFPQVPDAAVVKHKYIVAKRTTMYWNPAINAPRTHTTPAQYILELDSAGYVYNAHVDERFFNEVNEGDSVFFSQETKTFKLSR